jgi:hypothetical protein
MNARSAISACPMPRRRRATEMSAPSFPMARVARPGSAAFDFEFFIDVTDYKSLSARIKNRFIGNYGTFSNNGMAVPARTCQVPDFVGRCGQVGGALGPRSFM